MECKAKIAGIQTDFMSSAGIVTLSVGNQHLTSISELMNDDVDIKISKHRERRSLNANAYCWKLCTEIADVLTLQGQATKKEDVYVQCLKDYGQSDIITVLSSVPAADYFKYFDEAGQGNIKGKDYTSYRVYKGSSEYNTKEMSILLDGIIAEAETLGIHTITPKEAEAMKARWGVEV